jgi:hypothetical protein
MTCDCHSESRKGGTSNLDPPEPFGLWGLLSPAASAFGMTCVGLLHTHSEGAGAQSLPPSAPALGSAQRILATSSFS